MKEERKELRKMSRMELIEIIYALQQNERDLRAQLDEANAQLAEKIIQIDTAGSIAEASLRLSKVFEDAQAAADQYLASVKAQTTATSNNPRRSAALQSAHRTGASAPAVKQPAAASAPHAGNDVQAAPKAAASAAAVQSPKAATQRTNVAPSAVPVSPAAAPTSAGVPRAAVTGSLKIPPVYPSGATSPNARVVAPRPSGTQGFAAKLSRTAVAPKHASDDKTK